jgi:hypothetical protein
MGASCKNTMQIARKSFKTFLSFGQCCLRLDNPGKFDLERKRKKKKIPSLFVWKGGKSRGKWRQS